MDCLRHARHLACFMLGWFALSIGVAVASPMVHPQSIELVCAGGATKLLVKSDGGATEATGTTLDCPLCATAGTPPPAIRLAAEPPHPLGHALHPLVAAHIAARTASPLPARGPPSFS